MLAHGQIEEECTYSEETASGRGGHPIETALLTKAKAISLLDKYGIRVDLAAIIEKK